MTIVLLHPQKKQPAIIRHPPDVAISDTRAVTLPLGVGERETYTSDIQ